MAYSNSRKSLTIGRDEALRLFKKSPALAAWYPDVVEKYVKHGLVSAYKDEKDARVKLKMPGLQVGRLFGSCPASR